MLKQKLDAIVDSYKDQILSDIQKWVAVPSVAGEPEENAPFGREVRRALDTALETAKGYGFATRDAGRLLRRGDPVRRQADPGHVVPSGRGARRRRLDQWSPWGGRRLPTGKSSAGARMDDKGPALAALLCHARPCGKRAWTPWPTA